MNFYSPVLLIPIHPTCEKECSKKLTRYSLAIHRRLVFITKIYVDNPNRVTGVALSEHVETDV
jgi:hypothetical protein